SRRRHTRSKRDWSSDVCSSDLHSNDVFGVAFDDGIIAEIARDDIDSTAREGIFFLCDMWAGMDAKYSIGEAWVKEAIQRAREVQIGKLLVDGNWDNSEDA